MSSSFIYKLRQEAWILTEQGPLRGPEKKKKEISNTTNKNDNTLETTKKKKEKKRKCKKRVGEDIDKNNNTYDRASCSMAD